MTPYIIGIAGPSASGKSALCGLLLKKFPDMLHIELDNFYNGAFKEYKQWKNMDSPDALNFNELLEILKELKSGKKTIIPIYSKELNKRTGTIDVSPKKIILVEGFLLFQDKRIRDLLDLKIFVTVSEKIQIERRLKRQPNLDLEYFKKVVTPMFEKYGKPTMKYADFIINGDREIDDREKDFEGILKKKLPDSL